VVIVLDPAYVNAYALRAQAAMAALDWEAAHADWKHLMAIVDGSEVGNLDALNDKAEMIATWQKRREECAAQLALNHYEVLGLPRIASLEAVRRAYKELARQWHPDRQRQEVTDVKERASRRFERIRQAYEVLGEEKSKSAYDATLLLSEARPLMTADAKSTNIVDASSPCRSPPAEPAEGLLRARDELDSERSGRWPDNSRNFMSELIRQRSSSRNGTRGSKAGASIESPVGRRSVIDSQSSHSSRWFPSFRTSRCPSSPQACSAINGRSIHIDLFDARFVNADYRSDR
jgi:curved DNA-binding protein CbpA